MKCADRDMQVQRMSRLKIALACQGGGSQTAFTAGALKTLCQAQVGQDFDVVGISGTSGGAVCASLLWYSYLRGERPVWERLMKFWEENTAQGRPNTPSTSSSSSGRAWSIPG